MIYPDNTNGYDLLIRVRENVIFLHPGSDEKFLFVLKKSESHEIIFLNMCISPNELYFSIL